MGKAATSPIWQYFDKSVADPSVVICKIENCKSKVSRGSSNPRLMTNTNLVNHLQRNHKEAYNKYKEKDSENNEKKRKAQESNDVRGTILLNKKQKDEYLQQTLPEAVLNSAVWKKDNPNSKEGHRRILLMIIQDLRPYSDIMKGGLLQVIKWAQPKFEPGSDKFYRMKMEESFVRCRQAMQDKLAKDNPSSVSVVLDGWSSYHHGYVGVNIHYISEGWKRVKINLCCKRFDDSHTGEALATFVSDLMHEWNIYEKVGVFVTDSASNMKKMFDYLPFERVDCGNHTLQLSINDEIFNMSSVETLAAKCRAVCKYQNKSTQFAQALVAAQAQDQGDVDNNSVRAQGLYLVQDVATRWNSTFDMMDRFYQLKRAVTRILNDPKWEQVNIHMYNSDWELMGKVVKVLRVFKEATEMLSSSQASISQIIPLVTIIRESLRRGGDDQGVRTLKVKLSNSLERRFGHKEFDSKYAVATLLDPRYKKNFFQGKQAKESAMSKLLEDLKASVKEGSGSGTEHLVNQANAVVGEDRDEEESYTIESIMKKVIADNHEKEDDGVDSDIENKVLTEYLSSPVETSMCLDFWDKYEKGADSNSVKVALAQVARKYLTPPPTSTDVERLFSVAGNILTAERNRLLPESVDKLLFLKENIANLNFQL